MLQFPYQIVKQKRDIYILCTQLGHPPKEMTQATEKTIGLHAPVYSTPVSIVLCESKKKHQQNSCSTLHHPRRMAEF